MDSHNLCFLQLIEPNLSDEFPSLVWEASLTAVHLNCGEEKKKKKAELSVA